MLPLAAPGEFVAELHNFDEWTAGSIKSMADILADKASEVWYG